MKAKLKTAGGATGAGGWQRRSWRGVVGAAALTAFLGGSGPGAAGDGVSCPSPVEGPSEEAARMIPRTATESTVSVPPIDTRVPEVLEVATFALG